MADNIGNKAAHDYHLDIAPVQEGFYVKGAAHCDWGMKNRLSRLFDPKSGNTVMLAFDHGYIMGPTAGLERIDVVIPPLIPYVNVLMGTKGILRSCISPAAPVAKCVRVTYDTTVLFDEMSNGGGIACDIENAVRMNADCMAVQTFIGAPGESHFFGTLCDAFFFKVLFWIIFTFLEDRFQHNNSTVYDNTEINSAKRQKISRNIRQMHKNKSDKQ